MTALAVALGIAMGLTAWLPLIYMIKQTRKPN